VPSLRADRSIDLSARYCLRHVARPQDGPPIRLALAVDSLSEIIEV